MAPLRSGAFCRYPTQHIDDLLGLGCTFESPPKQAWFASAEAEPERSTWFTNALS